MELKIIVSEPWNFISSDGENVLKVKFIKMWKEHFVFECCSEFEGMSKYLIFQDRDSCGAYNLYKCDDLDNINEEDLDFIIIGEFEDRNAFWEEVKKAGYFNNY